jgi:hypothetical protein
MTCRAGFNSSLGFEIGQGGENAQMLVHRPGTTGPFAWHLTRFANRTLICPSCQSVAVDRAPKSPAESCAFRTL